MKDSGIEWIGEIPEDVEVINNKYILEFIKGKNPNEINIDKIGLPYIGASDLDMDGDIHEYSNYCNEDLPLALKDDTLILWDGARAGLIGIGHEGYISSTIIKVTPRVDYINKKFWYWYLKGFQPLMNDWVGGTTIPHMNRKFINDICLLKFPIIQQQKIANFLDQKVSEIDHILKKTRESIEEYKKYKQSLITEAVTKGLNPDVEMKDSGIEWIGEIPKHWEVDKLRYILSLSTGLSVTKAEFVDEGVECINYGDIHSRYNFDYVADRDLLSRVPCNYVDRKISAIANDGDFVFCDTSEDIEGSGNCLFVRDNKGRTVLAGSHTIIGKPIKEINSVYLAYLLKSRNIKAQIECSVIGIKVYSITQKILNNVIFSLPPIEEQREIAEFLDHKLNFMESLIKNKIKLISDLETYKKSLIYECVTGKREVD